MPSDLQVQRRAKWDVRTCQGQCDHFRAFTNSLREALTLSALRAQRMYCTHASPAISGGSCKEKGDYSLQ